MGGFIQCAPIDLRGTGTLQSLCQKMRYGLIALLTVALLVGPCLSFLGAFGLSPAHAHAGISQMSSHGASADCAHAQHGTHSAAPEQKGADPATPHHPSPLSCEELCEGWAVKKSPRPWAMSSQAEPDDTPAVPHLIVLKVVFLPIAGDTKNRPRALSPPTLPLSQAAYRLTGRYRL